MQVEVESKAVLDANPSSIQSWNSGGNNQKELEVHQDKVELGAG